MFTAFRGGAPVRPPSKYAPGHTVAKQFHYRYVNCELLRYTQSELAAIGDWEAEGNRTDEGKGR